MSEEDQMLVALAALHGARFIRVNTGFWRAVGGKEAPPVNKFTIGRAANHYLKDEGLRLVRDYWDYERRTDDIRKPEDVDPEFVAQVLA